MAETALLRVGDQSPLVPPPVGLSIRQLERPRSIVLSFPRECLEIASLETLNHTLIKSCKSCSNTKWPKACPDLRRGNQDPTSLPHCSLFV